MNIAKTILDKIKNDNGLSDIELENNISVNNLIRCYYK